MSNDAQLLETAKSITNARFVEEILQKSENDPSIKVSNVEVKFATNKGDNYTSDMFRLIINYHKNKDCNAVNRKQIVVKFAPLAQGAAQDMITNSPLFDTEIKMMSDTLEKMNNLLGPENRLNGRCLHVQRGNPLFLMIEDLAPLGFRMAAQKTGLDLNHCLLAIQNLARFHASSVAVCEKEPRLKEVYRESNTFKSNQSSDIIEFFKASVKQLSEEVSKWQEVDSKYSEKLDKLADVFFERGAATCISDPNEFNVINHGDSWTNNMLFKYDSQGKPIKHIFVDFQASSYSSPVMDLLYFFNTSITDDMLVKHESLLMQEYRITLATTMMKLGCSTKAPTVKELKDAMAKKLFWRLFATFIVLPFILVEKDAVFKLEDLLNEDGKFNNPGMRSELFRAVIARRLPEFDKSGLLD